MLSKIREGVVQQFDQNIPVENVDAHRRQVEFLLPFDPEPEIPVLVQPQGVERGWVLRFFDKARDAALGVDLHDAQGLSRLSRDRNCGNRHVRGRDGVLGKDAPKIHPVKLVAAEDQRVIKVVV